VSKLNRPHALTHDKNHPTNEHTNEQNGKRRNDCFTMEDAVAAPRSSLFVSPSVDPSDGAMVSVQAMSRPVNERSAFKPLAVLGSQ